VHPITSKAILGVLILRGGRRNGKEGERDNGKRGKEKAREGMGEKEISGARDPESSDPAGSRSRPDLAFEDKAGIRLGQIQIHKIRWISG